MISEMVMDFEIIAIYHMALIVVPQLIQLTSNNLDNVISKPYYIVVLVTVFG